MIPVLSPYHLYIIQYTFQVERILMKFIYMYIYKNTNIYIIEDLDLYNWLKYKLILSICLKQNQIKCWTTLYELKRATKCYFNLFLKNIKLDPRFNESMHENVEAQAI